jgi:endonuclease/exonuclease/phosphatase family metal-dependent hydrolase
LWYCQFVQMRIFRVIYERSKWVLHNTIMLVNIIFVLLLLLSYLSPYASPREIWVLSFFGLAYPFLLAINIVFVIYWALKRRWFFLYSFIMILIGWTHFSNTFPVRLSRNNPSNPENTFTFLSFNVRLFNLYNWIDDASVKSEIFGFLVNEDPDILCIQEYFYNTEDPFNKSRDFRRLHERYSHIEYSSSNNQNFNFGIATFSKYPIVNTGRINFANSSNISIYTDVAINGDTVRIFNNHLQSVQFTQNDINFIDSLGRHNRERNISGARDIASKLKAAYISRSRQVGIIVSHIRQSPYPVIITGDFNDTPVSYTYRQLRSQGLDDAFVRSGRGIGSTYIARMPFFRIDYILHSRELESFNFESPRIELSDHYPLKCEFSFRRPDYHPRYQTAP